MKPFVIILSFLLIFLGKIYSQTAIDRFLSSSYMKGASASIMVKDILNETVLFSYDANREVIPASVMKLVTTATTLELLGEKFRYETKIMYDGVIKDSILEGNIYILGSGDPTTGSSEIGGNQHKLFHDWIKAIRVAGINAVSGSVIADESIFDTEGISMKILREDMGSYYGQGSYGINIFDNRYTVFLQTGQPGMQPAIVRTEPYLPFMQFHNYLTVNDSNRDSMYIFGFPFSNDRYLYGTIPSNRFEYQQKGDIPDPPLFLAQYLTELLLKDSVKITGKPTCYRLLLQNGEWRNSERKTITTTTSLPLKDLVHITNYKSHNLYADAFLKTISLLYGNENEISCFHKGVKTVKGFWDEKGIDTSSLWMFDGCGLAVTDKVSASFLCDLLSYMHGQSPFSKSFIESLPRAGMEGTVTNFLRGSKLQGKARMKSGSMSRVRSFSGYVTIDNNIYAVAIIVNNFSCSQSQIRADIERLFLSFF